MDESVKRRERLRAMRMEASEAGVNDVESSTPSRGLANPFVEMPSTPNVAGSTTRFDFYTDPMAAFSGDDRRSKVSNHIPPQHLTPPRPAYQPQSNYAPNPNMYQAQVPYCSSGPYRSPTPVSDPFDAHQQTPPPMWNDTSNRFPSNSAGGGNFPGHGFVQGGTPNFLNSGQPSGGPSFQNFGQPRGSPRFPNSGQPRGSPRFSNPGQPRGNPDFSNHGQPRSHWVSNSPGPGHQGSPSPGSGRGGGRWSGSMSPSSGRGGGRGSGSRVHVSAEFRPYMYYSKSMVEDPWKFLEPVVWKREKVDWKTLKTPDSLKSWLPDSIRGKKARVLGASNASSSQPSLAEYLAASFNEAVKKESVNDEFDEAVNKESVNDELNGAVKKESVNDDLNEAVNKESVNDKPSA